MTPPRGWNAGNFSLLRIAVIDLAKATMSSLPQQIAADPLTPSNNLARGVPAVARAARLFFTTRMLIFLARNSFRSVYVEEEFMPTMFTSRASLTLCKRFLMSSETRFLTYLLMPSASLTCCAFVDSLRLCRLDPQSRAHRRLDGDPLDVLTFDRRRLEVQDEINKCREVLHELCSIKTQFADHCVDVAARIATELDL